MGYYGFPSNRVLPSVYSDEISYYEELCRIRAKLQELVEMVGDTATIKELQDAIAQINAAIASLRAYVDDQDAKTGSAADAYSDARNLELEERLLDVMYRITTGDILVQSQVDGRKKQHVQFELDETYDWLRPFAISAGESDYLQLSAQDLDSIMSNAMYSAYEVDMYIGAYLMGANHALLYQYFDEQQPMVSVHQACWYVGNALNAIKDQYL